MNSRKYDQIFYSHLRIKVMALGSFPTCLYRETIRMQCFPPTHTNVGDDLYQICSKSQVDGACLHCMAAYSYTVASFAVLHTIKHKLLSSFWLPFCSEHSRLWHRAYTRSVVYQRSLLIHMRGCDQSCTDILVHLRFKRIVSCWSCMRLKTLVYDIRCFWPLQ